MSKQGSDDRPMTFPFGSFDIFSYLIPGATVILGVMNFEHWYQKITHSDCLAPVSSTLLGSAPLITGDHTVYAITFAAALLCVIYVSGHVVSSISSFCLDKIYVAKAQGYPYETILLLPRASGPGFRRPDSKGFYQGIFFWLNLYLILRFYTFFLNPVWLTPSLHFIEAIFILAVIAKQASTIVRGMPSSDLHRWLKKRGPNRWLVKPAKLYLGKIFPLPFLAISRAVETHIRTGRSFEVEMRDLYVKSFAEIFGLDPRRVGSDNFWLCEMFIAKESPEIDRRLKYWRDMYTYARNLATACYVAFLYCFFFVYLQYYGHFGLSRRDLFILFSIPLGYFVMAGVLAIRFRYIYVNHFNRVLYRAFIFLCRSRRSDHPETERS